MVLSFKQPDGFVYGKHIMTRGTNKWPCNRNAEDHRIYIIIYITPLMHCSKSYANNNVIQLSHLPDEPFHILLTKADLSRYKQYLHIFKSQWCKCLLHFWLNQNVFFTKGPVEMWNFSRCTTIQNLKLFSRYKKIKKRTPAWTCISYIVVKVE